MKFQNQILFHFVDQENKISMFCEKNENKSLKKGINLKSLVPEAAADVDLTPDYLNFSYETFSETGSLCKQMRHNLHKNTCYA